MAINRIEIKGFLLFKGAIILQCTTVIPVMCLLKLPFYSHVCVCGVDFAN